MLSIPIIASLVAATDSPLQGAWSDPSYQLALWALLIWVLFELTEAVRHWSRHPWVQRAVRLRRSTLQSALAGLNLLLAGTLAGLGFLMVYAALRNDHGGGLRTIAVGAGALFLAIIAAWVVFAKFWQREGAGAASEPDRRSNP